MTSTCSRPCCGVLVDQAAQPWAEVDLQRRPVQARLQLLELQREVQDLRVVGRRRVVDPLRERRRGGGDDAQQRDLREQLAPVHASSSRARSIAAPIANGSPSASAVPWQAAGEAAQRDGLPGLDGVDREREREQPGVGDPAQLIQVRGRPQLFERERGRPTLRGRRSLSGGAATGRPPASRMLRVSVATWSASCVAKRSSSSRATGVSRGSWAAWA